MAELHKAVIAALKVTFSDQKFEEYLRDQAADTEQIAASARTYCSRFQSWRAPRQAGQGNRRERRHGRLGGRVEATQQQRRQAEARVADLEGYERDLRDQQEQIERLRKVWGSWAAALDADVPAARQILKKILVGRIYVRPVGPGDWRFAGISRYDGALRGGLGARPRSGPRSGRRTTTSAG